VTTGAFQIRYETASRATRTVALGLSLVLVAAACGGVSALEDLETQMTDVFLSELDVALEDITCTEGAQIEPASQFQCTAAVVEGEGRLRVGVLIDTDGRAEFTRENALVDLESIETEVSEDLSRGIGVRITVECGAALVRIVEVGGTFACSAIADNGEQRGVEIQVDDLNATTQWRLLAV